jgi:transcription antitermination protein NusB
MSKVPVPNTKRMGKDMPMPRTLSRMAAVQALYQMDLSGTDLTDVIDQFRSPMRKGEAPADQADDNNDDGRGANLDGADIQFFTDLLHGVVRRQTDIDPLIDRQLAAGWRLVRIDSILRAILRAGAFELMDRPDVPVRVAINEYINLGHAFFSDDEPRVINGVLDALARDLRSAELAAKSAK